MLISPIGQENNDIASASSVSQKSADFASYMEEKDNSLAAIFTEAAETYHVPVNLLTAMAKQESAFQANATSKSGAMGIMQLMPATASYFGCENPYDPRENIMTGAKYISQLLDTYNGDTSLALAAYNAGSGNVKKYGGIPPFKETQNYVAKIMNYMEEGVTLPDGTQFSSGKSSYGTYNNGAGSYVSGAVNPGVPASPATLEEILERFFSYDDYLRFLDLFLEHIEQFAALNSREEQQVTTANNSTEQLKVNISVPNHENTETTPYPGIRYNQNVLKLLNQPKDEA